MADLIQTTITTEEKVQTAEDVAAELAAEEAAAKETPSGDDRPEWLPEKFKSAEDLAKAYSELERKQSSGDETPKDGLTIKPSDAEKAAEDAGLDFDALTSKFAEKGSLEDADYEALEKSGIKRETVDKYIEGQQALVAQYETKVMAEFGSAETYSEMTQWAAQNLSEAQIDLFNEAVESGNVEKAVFAINGLKSQYVAANGSEPGRMIDGTPTSTKQGYQSEAEMLRDMEDPRYWSDTAFREECDRKFAAAWG